MSRLSSLESQATALRAFSAASIVALSAFALSSFATPASAGAYCRADVTSRVVSCSFDSLEQCQWTAAGRGGDCFRDPFLPARDRFAYAPNALKRGASRGRP
jgi:hypothetical protein